MMTTFEEILVDIRDQLDDTVKYWLAHSLDDRWFVLTKYFYHLELCTKSDLLVFLTQ